MKNLYASLQVPVGFYVAYGEVAPLINNYIKEVKADLVIMGTQGVRGAMEFLIGSNTEKVVRHSHVPVLAIKKYVDLYAVKTIVFPTTLDIPHSLLIEHIKKLQKLFQATLHILYVNTPASFKTDTKIANARKQYLNQCNFNKYCFAIRNDNNVEDGIVNYAHEVKADMIAMVTHGKRGLAHLFAGSITEGVVNHADYPIWVYSSKMEEEMARLNRHKN